MNGLVMRLFVTAMAAMLVFASVAFATEKQEGGDNLTEGQIEEYAYEKRSDAVQALEKRIDDIKKGLDQLAEDVKDSEIKKALVEEMQQLSAETGDMVKQLENADETVWPELKNRAAEMMDKLEAFFSKMEEQLTQ